VSTLVANGVILIGILWAMVRHGYPREMSLLFLALLPATLLAGPWIAMSFVCITALANPNVRGWCVEARSLWQRKLASRTIAQ
jgi:hypothetical protein